MTVVNKETADRPPTIVAKSRGPVASPLPRLGALFDEGSLTPAARRGRLRHARRDRRRARHTGRRLRERPDRAGRRDVARGLRRRRLGVRPRRRGRLPDRRLVALRRRAAARRRRVPRRRRPGLRGDDARLRPGPADLGRPRPGGRRRGVRPRAHRHRRPRPGRPRVRHRPGRRPLGHRRGRRHAPPRWARSRMAGAVAWCTSWGLPRGKRSTLRAGSLRCSAGRASSMSRP